MEFLDNCRLCLEEFKNHQRTEINEALRKEYFELTNWTLQNCPDYSKNVCKKCLKDLQKSLKIKKKFQENQLKLKDLIEKEVKPEIKIENVVKIKEETVVEVDPISLELQTTLENGESLELNEEISFDQKPIKTKISKKKTVTSAKRSKSSVNNPQKQNERVKCQFCQRILSKESIRKHVRTLHEKFHQYECDLCGRRTSRRHCLKEHMQTHLNNKSYHCDLCNLSFKSKQRLNNHKKVVHEKRYSRACHYCGHESNSQYALDNHIRSIHTKIPVIFCEECGKGFYSAGRLINHRKKQHLPPDLKKCKICSKEVVDMKHHLLLHTGYKHKCIFRLEDSTICGKILRSSSRLKEHVNIVHRNFRKWNCKHCDASFARSGQLNTHIRAAHLNFKLTCIVSGCNSIFTAKKSMAAHLKMVHKDLDENEKKMYAEEIRKIPLPKIEDK